MAFDIISICVTILSFGLSLLPWRWNIWRRIINLILIVFTPMTGIYRKYQNIDNLLQKLTFRLLAIISYLMLIFSGSIIASILIFRYYIPQDSLKYPVNFSYQKCDNTALACSYPSFFIKFEYLEQLFTLSSGQKYNFYLDLTVPDSISNHEAGMFSIWSVLSNKYGNVVASTEKSVMLQFHSPLYMFLSSLLSFPAVFLGFYKEQQVLTRLIFENYLHVNDAREGANDLKITLHTRHINVYESYLRIEADFSGLQYYMHHYRLIMMAFFVSFFFFAFTILSIIVRFQCRKFTSALLGNNSEITRIKSKEFDDDNSQEITHENPPDNSNIRDYSREN